MLISQEECDPEVEMLGINASRKRIVGVGVGVGVGLDEGAGGTELRLGQSVSEISTELGNDGLPRGNSVSKDHHAAYLAAEDHPRHSKQAFRVIVYRLSWVVKEL